MAERRKGGASHEGPRAIPEERWEESARAERRLDGLAEGGIPPRDSPPGREGKYDEELPEGMRRALDEQDERIAEQARTGPRSAEEGERPPEE